MNRLEAGKLDCPHFKSYCKTDRCRAWTSVDEDHGFCSLCDAVELEFYKSQYLQASLQEVEEIEEDEEELIRPYRIAYRVDDYGNEEILQGGELED